MGNNCENKAPLNYNQIFFYKNLNSNSGINEEKEITQKVKLTFSLKNINDSSPKSINLILEDPEKKKFSFSWKHRNKNKRRFKFNKFCSIFFS